MNPLSATMLNDIEDRAVELCMSVIEGVVELMQADGIVYGDEKLNREERMLAFLAMQQSRELEALEAVRPELAEKYARQFFNDLAQSPVMRG